MHGIACHSLSWTGCLFPTSFTEPVIGAGLSNLLSIYPTGTSSRQPGIEAAAKGRIAPSGNAENADLVLVRAAAAAGVLWI